METTERRLQGWEATLGAITLFVEDLAACKDFYQLAFQTDPVFEEGDSVVFRVDDVLINLLAERAVPELIDPAPMAPASAGTRAVYTLHVEDVDAIVALLAAADIELLNGPIDRWWGPRTASFRDPSGHIWEIASQAGD
jgi:lactoylglutathione lyase